jgi:hypothetical protein
LQFCDFAILQFYLKNESSHFCDFGRGLFEAVEVIFGEDEVPLLPSRKQLVPLLPQQALLQRAEVGRVELLLGLKTDNIKLALNVRFG